MKKRKWYGLEVTIGDDWEFYDDVAVYVSDDELEDALENGEIAKYFAYKVASSYLSYWKRNPDDSYAEYFINLINNLKDSDAYDSYEDEIDEALDGIAAREHEPISVDMLGDILTDYTEVIDNGEYEFDEEDDDTQCPYEIALYWDNGLVL